MSVRLLILGLLRQGPLHGYEIKRIIATEMADWTSVAVGSIYFALDKLSAQALIEVRETSRDGGRPEKTVYAITASGRNEFLSLLRQTWAEVERGSFPLDTGVAFMDSLPKAELRGYLKRRIGILEGILAGLALHRSETLEKPELPTQARFIFSHHELHLRAELEWTQEVLGSLGR